MSAHSQLKLLRISRRTIRAAPGPTRASGLLPLRCWTYQCRHAPENRNKHTRFVTPPAGIIANVNIVVVGDEDCLGRIRRITIARIERQNGRTYCTVRSFQYEMQVAEDMPGGATAAGLPRIVKSFDLITTAEHVIGHVVDTIRREETFHTCAIAVIYQPGKLGVDYLDRLPRFGKLRW